MSEVNTLVQQAISAYKANDKATAKDLLLKAVDLDEHNEQAWMWMSAVVDSLDEQQICLENVIQINPHNERARKGLAVINEKLGKSAAPPPADPAPAQSDSPWEGTGFDSSPFSTPDQTAAGSAAPPAPGSGAADDPTTGEQYDSWIDSLGISSDSSAASTPATPFTPEPANDDPWASLNNNEEQANPFVADSSASSGSDPWEQTTSTPQQQTDPWGNPTSGSSGSNPFSSDASGGDPWGSVTGVDPWATNSGQNAPDSDPFGTSYPAQEEAPDEAEEERATTGFQFAEDSEPTYSSFDFDAEDDVETVVDDFSFGEDDFQDDPFGDDEDDDLSGFDPFADDEDNINTVIAARGSNYLQQIPEELRGKGGGSSRGTLLLVAILLLANLAAAAGLMMG